MGLGGTAGSCCRAYTTPAAVLYPCRLLVGELRVKSYDWCSPAAATGKPETIQVCGALILGWLQGVWVGEQVADGTYRTRFAP